MTEFSVVSASQLDRSNYDEQLPIPLLVQLHASLTNEASAGGHNYICNTFYFTLVHVVVEHNGINSTIYVVLTLGTHHLHECPSPTELLDYDCQTIQK